MSIACRQRSRIILLIGMAILCSPPAWLLADDIPSAVLEAEQQRIAAIARASKASISVFARGGRGGGSGVVVTPDGYALTNFHVVKPAGSHMQCSMPDGNLYDAVIVGIDPVGDVALIKLHGRDDFPHAEIGDSDKLRVGDWCFAIGNPFLLATDFQPTISYGIVSGVHRYQYPAGTLLEYADCIQTDAAINPGNSGGPLFNAEGRLVGINGRGSFEKRGRVNVGVGYAISINQIKNFTGYLRSGRIVDHATLGANVATDEDGRVIVSNIIESCDAYRRGLRYGDEVISFGGRSIDTANTFKNVLGIYPKGWRIPLTYARDGQRHNILVRLAGVHSSGELIEKVQGKPRPIPIKPPQPGLPKKIPGEDEKKQPKDRKPRQLPQGHPRIGKKPIPPEIAKFIKTRRGYANYYFNELHRDRVWKSFLANGIFSELNGDWTLIGTMDDGGQIVINLGKDEVTATIGQNEFRADLTGDLDTQNEPTRSGGLLVALHLWQRMLTTGPKKFGDVFYLGTAPIQNRKPLVDVLVGTHNVVQANYQFDPANGQLLGLEYYSSKDTDPCELLFSDYREAQGRMLPHRLEVRFGDHLFGTIELKQFALTKTAEKEA